MIAFGCAITETEPFERYAGRGIRLAAEPDSPIFPYAAVGTIGRSYNLLLEAAAGLPDLEALVLVHPYIEIADPQLCSKVRAAFADPQVAVLGMAGATGVSSLAWWEGEITRGSVIHRFLEGRGGELPGYAWAAAKPPPAEVDTVDGALFILSPWAVRNVRFDEELMYGHGFDVEYCRQVRAQDHKVTVIDLKTIQHHSLKVVNDLELWTEAHIALSRKWALQADSNGDGGVDWKQRARRAEAEREAVRALVYSNKLRFEAESAPLESAVESATTTLAWRLTTPLRRINKWRRDRLRRDEEVVPETDDWPRDAVGRNLVLERPANLVSGDD